MRLRSWVLAAGLCFLAACGSSGSGAPRGGMGGAGGTHDAGTAPIGAVDGGVVSAAAGTWTWVPLAGTTCGDGSVAGIGVNLESAS